MGAELSSVADDLSCIECRKKRSPHAPVLVQPPRFPGSMPSTASPPSTALAETARRDSTPFASSLPGHKESSSATIANVAAVFGEPPTRTKLAAALNDDDDSEYAYAPAATARAAAGSWRASAAAAPAASAPTADATTGITLAKRTSDDDDEYYYSDYEYEVERRAKEKKAAAADDEVRSEGAYYSDYYTDEDEPKQPARFASTPTRA